jgi:DNA replication protein DnaC
MANKLAQKEMKAAFTLDDENRDQVTAFVAYFTGDVETAERYEMDLRKGIMIFGNPGSGKSMLFRILKACLSHDDYRRFFYSKYFTAYNTEHPAKMFMKEGDAGIEKFVKPIINGFNGPMANACLFDDLGAEEVKNNFGNKKEVMAEVILQRYDHLLESGLVTHFTTNLSPDEIEGRYSTRIRSRLKQMCNVLDLGTCKEYKDRR